MVFLKLTFKAIGLGLLLTVFGVILYPTVMEWLYDGDGELSVGQDGPLLIWYSLTLPTFGVEEGREYSFKISRYADYGNSHVSLCLTTVDEVDFSSLRARVELRVRQEGGKAVLVVDERLNTSDRFIGMSEEQYRELANQGYSEWQLFRQLGDPIPNLGCFGASEFAKKLNLDWAKDYAVTIRFHDLDQVLIGAKAKIAVAQGWK